MTKKLNSEKFVLWILCVHSFNDDGKEIIFLFWFFTLSMLVVCWFYFFLIFFICFFLSFVHTHQLKAMFDHLLWRHCNLFNHVTCCHSNDTPGTSRLSVSRSRLLMAHSLLSPLICLALLARRRHLDGVFNNKRDGTGREFTRLSCCVLVVCTMEPRAQPWRKNKAQSEIRDIVWKTGTPLTNHKLTTVRLPPFD